MMTAPKLILTAVLAYFAGTAASFSEVAVYSTVGESLNFEMWGTQKAETYDVAVLLSDPALVGKEIMGARVPLTSSDAITDISVWLSGELKLESKVNVPDIESVKAVSEDNMVEVSFSKPYTIPEEGLYLGVSFATEGNGNVASYPVTTVKGIRDCGFFVHTRRTYLKWKNMADDQNRVPVMYAVLGGDIPQASVVVASVSSTIAQVDREFDIPVTLRNEGAGLVSSIDYTVGMDGSTREYHQDYGHGIMPYYLGEVTVMLPVEAVAEIGRKDYTFTLTKVNGMNNLAQAASAAGYVDIAEYCPVNRPLLEEYTGLGCGWCPRGIAAFERMSALYPGLFVGAAFHEGDDMTAEGKRPNAPSGQPAAYLNRTIACDPYCGTDMSGFGIEALWNEARMNPVPVGIDVSLAWADEEKSVLEATSEVVYVAECERNVALAYLLLADGISDKSWVQSNYYSGASGANYIPEMAQFFEADAHIVGMKFNDIVAMQSLPKGVAGSLPAEIVPYEKYHNTYTFDLSEAYSTKGYLLAQHPDQLKVVAIVVDADSGEAINCNVASTAELASVHSIISGPASFVAWYDLSGRKVSHPSAGIFIKVETDSRGAVKASKIKL